MKKKNETIGKKGKISREILSHFRCVDCNKWWTIGDANKSQKSWFCPWCGKKQTFRDVTPKVFDYSRTKKTL